MKIAIVGVTGLVGTTFLEILEKTPIHITQIILVASSKSIGKRIVFKNIPIPIITIDQAIALKPHIVLFSAGSSISLEYAPLFAAQNAVVIDNSSAWRMNKEHKLIVPEINGNILTKKDKIIANPNCSTIQMVLALHKLHELYKIKRIVVSTYQSVSGGGQKAINQLIGERENIEHTKVLPHQIDLNLIPQIDLFTENDYTKEEMKMVHETKKILNDNSIKVTATCVRVPVINSHSESVNVEFNLAIELDKVKHILKTTKGVQLIDDVKNSSYPMPINVSKKDDVFIGRVRLDSTQPNTINMWIVSDNVRKGAALNAIQIAQYVIENKLVHEAY